MPDLETPAPGRWSGPAERSIERLRHHDMDDLLLMSYLLEGLTVTVTSKRLGLSQPAVSHRVRRLEETLGTPILEKAGRSLKLTERGAGLCRLATDALQLLITAVGVREDSSLAIAVGRAEWLPTVQAAAFRQLEKEPGSKLDTFAATEHRCLKMLEAGEVDACVVATEWNDRRFRSLRIGEDDPVLVASPSLAGKLDGPDQIAKQVFFDVAPNFPLLGGLTQGPESAMFADVRVLGSLDAVIRAVEAGLGVTLLPNLAAQVPVAAGKLTALQTEWKVESREIFCIHRDQPEIRVKISRLFER